MDSGYRYCACRDCFETVVGGPGTMCDKCKKAGCKDSSTNTESCECKRIDAY